MLSLIIAQLNMLLCLVNDVLDIKLIQNERYERKMNSFNPLKTLNFVQRMFKPMADMQKTQIKYKAVACEALQIAPTHNFEDELIV